MQTGRRKALKSFVLHIRVSAAHEQQPVRPAPLCPAAPNDELPANQAAELDELGAMQT
jgi:hypothetical protein